MDQPLSSSVRRVRDALAAFGASGEVRELPGSTRTAADAAVTLGVDVGAIANSLIFLADGESLLVMTSGAHRVDVEALAARLRVARIRRASAQQVHAATGQAIGGVAPVGHPAPIRTVVDEGLRAHPQLWAAAGTPHAVFPTTFDELVSMTAGAVHSVEA
ncbi:MULTISPECIES: YbaK/EbsC family protein [unclassified Microbacterium]|uniref:YbaK/EbsC family protein n=1 Tax=unclassified Microbacterium TaxID=2609290 RepID=UPI001604E2B1|nr:MULTISPECIES: YbaK/EbsC family protein [unclassified Microbacterium]QNA92972.1 YbaK/EbsC family protein [Microbacterium sp. Se63.02b]QYM63138.1 YbaK/EbsC family protein [Microbacterium sp. Se5.02b]